MNTYLRRAEGLTPPCPARSVDDLSLAAEALGLTLVFGSELSFEIQAADQNPRHPVHVSASDPASHQLFVILQGMLIAERWLIEFLLGPPAKRFRDDICVDCFNRNWRFPLGEIADELFDRRKRINKLVLHPTWDLIDFSARNWTVNRIRRCADGLELFANDLSPVHPTVASSLLQHVQDARTALSTGRADGFMWLQLQPEPRPGIFPAAPAV